jgi:hypothetical protein
VLDLFDEGFVNRWARRVILTVLFAGLTWLAVTALVGPSTPSLSTVLGVQLTTVPQAESNDETTTVDADGLLAALGAIAPTTTPEGSSPLPGSSANGSTGPTTNPAPGTESSRPPTTRDTTTTSATTTTTVAPTTTTLTTTTTTVPATTTTTTTVPATTTTTTTVPATTTTTTTVPATTTTTTTVPGSVGVFVADLNPGGNVVGALWEPSVQVRLALTGQGSRRDIEVTGQWSGAFTGTVVGSTNPSGRVTLTAPAISADSLTFTVVSVAGSGYVYQPSLNVVTQITVIRGDAN